MKVAGGSVGPRRQDAAARVQAGAAAALSVFDELAAVAALFHLHRGPERFEARDQVVEPARAVVVPRPRIKQSRATLLRATFAFAFVPASHRTEA